MSHRSSSRRRRHLERQIRLLQWAVIGVGGVAGLLVLGVLVASGPRLDASAHPLAVPAIVFGAALLAALLLAGVSASVGRVAAAVFNAFKLHSAQFSLGEELRRSRTTPPRTRETA